MRIELIDREYWLKKCEEELQKIYDTRVRDKQDYTNKVEAYKALSWWRRFCDPDPRNGWGWPTYGLYGEEYLLNAKSMLESENTGTIELNEKEWSWIR